MIVDTKQFTQGLLAAIFCMLLNGCMGAPLAQQLLSSVVLNGADKIINNAHEAQQREASNHRVMKDSPPDPYWASFVTAGFQRVAPIEEPLPALEKPAEQVNSTTEISPFVRVIVWNMLVGEEKLSVLEKAYASGSMDLPPKKDWGQLRVATGALEGEHDQQHIVFIVPPELGRLNSGQQTIVELGNPGDLNIARYTTNN